MKQRKDAKNKWGEIVALEAIMHTRSQCEKVKKCKSAKGVRGSTAHHISMAHDARKVKNCKKRRRGQCWSGHYANKWKSAKSVQRNNGWPRVGGDNCGQFIMRKSIKVQKAYMRGHWLFSPSHPPSQLHPTEVGCADVHQQLQLSWQVISEMGCLDIYLGKLADFAGVIAANVPRFCLKFGR